MEVEIYKRLINAIRIRFKDTYAEPPETDEDWKNLINDILAVGIDTYFEQI